MHGGYSKEVGHLEEAKLLIDDVTFFEEGKLLVDNTTFFHNT